MRRSSLFWGGVLILLGGLMFLNAAGVKLPGNLTVMQLFWPILLILLGIWVMLGVFFRGSTVEDENFSVDLQGATQADLRINHGAGRLKVGTGAQPGMFLSGTASGDVSLRTDVSSDGRLDVRLSSSAVVFPLIGGDGLNWTLNLNRDIPMTMRLETGASASELDLRDLRVTDIRLNTGASKTELTLPANAGMTKVNVEMGAASLDVTIPQGVAARIRVQQGVSAVNVDTARFPRSNDVYQSTDYESAQNRADISVQAGAGEVNIR